MSENKVYIYMRTIYCIKIKSRYYFEAFSRIILVRVYFILYYSVHTVEVLVHTYDKEYLSTNATL